MKFTISDQEGLDFMQNMHTCRVNYPGGRVHTSYVRFKDEESDEGLEWGREMIKSMVHANF